VGKERRSGEVRDEWSQEGEMEDNGINYCSKPLRLKQPWACGPLVREGISPSAKRCPGAAPGLWHQGSRLSFVQISVMERTALTALRSPHRPC